MYTNNGKNGGEKEVLCCVRAGGCLSYKGRPVPFDQMLRLHPQLHDTSLEGIADGPICIVCAENLYESHPGTVFMTAGGYRLNGDRLAIAYRPDPVVMRPRTLTWPRVLDLGQVRADAHLIALQYKGIKGTEELQDPLLQAGRLIRMGIRSIRSVSGNQRSLNSAQGFLARSENRNLPPAERWVLVGYAIDMVNCLILKLKTDPRLQRSCGIC